MQKVSFRKFFLIFFLVVALAVALIILFTGNYPILPENDQAHHPLETLYQSADLEFSELKISAWAKIKNNAASQSQMDDLLSLLEKEYCLKLDTQWDKTDHYLFAKGTAGNLRVSIASINAASSTASDYLGETYLALSLENLGFAEYQGQRAKLMEVFRNFNADPAVSETLVSYMPGRLEVHDQELFVNTLFGKINGIIVEGVTDDKFVSYCGYTSAINNSIEVMGQKINLNIASRYHSIDDRTYVYMGTPLIHCQY
ncbi:MAG: YwmB family TATA-box binding protein [Bacillota bacterium]